MTTFPLWLNPAAASKYLKEVLGIGMTTKTLRNRTCLGTGPQWAYWGCRPYTTTALLDDWVEANFADVPANGHQVRSQRSRGVQARAVGSLSTLQNEEEKAIGAQRAVPRSQRPHKSS
jgi:hypothetical protein